MNRPASEMAELLAAQAEMKRVFIRDHSGGKDARPDWVIALAKRDLSVLEQAANHYLRSEAGHG